MLSNWPLGSQVVSGHTLLSGSDTFRRTDCQRFSLNNLVPSKFIKKSVVIVYYNLSKDPVVPSKFNHISSDWPASHYMLTLKNICSQTGCSLVAVINAGLSVAACNIGRVLALPLWVAIHKDNTSTWKLVNGKMSFLWYKGKWGNTEMSPRALSSLLIMPVSLPLFILTPILSLSPLHIIFDKWCYINCVYTNEDNGENNYNICYSQNRSSCCLISI